MTEIYESQSGDSPLLISVPHAGSHIPDKIAQYMTEIGRSSIDTDWCVDELYPFAVDIGASLIKAHHSRYVVDLNRNFEDTELYPGQVKTGLCPLQTFDGEDIYKDDYHPDEAEVQARIDKYWQPYHDAVRA
jgi:N-formylglutamate deformylase